ncbi:MAG: ABC-type dipeptide/oligopeptide/nickel transport system ATPase subunit, partial [Paracoccaceae bacterium]
MLLDIRNLAKTYTGAGQSAPVFNDVSLQLDAGETL